MSQAVTVQTIQDRVVALCDLAGITANTSINPTVLLDFIRTAASMLGGLINEYSDEQLLTTSANLSTQADVSIVSLPTAFSNLVRISWLKSDTEEIELSQANADEWRANTNGSYTSWDGFGMPRYRLMGANVIELYPTPPAVYTLRAYYSTGIYVTALTDVIQCRDGWDQWIVYQTCMMVRAKQQKDASDFAGPLAVFDATIRRQLKRDRYGIKRVRDRRDHAWFMNRSRNWGGW